MYRYAGQSSSATKVSQFRKAPQVTNPAGKATQSAAVTNATTTSPASNTPKALAAASSGTSGGSSGSAAAGGASSAATKSSTDPMSEAWFLLTGQSSFPSNLGSLVNGYSPFAGLFYNTEGLPYFSTGMANSFTQIAKSVGAIGGAAPAVAKALPGLGGLGGMLGGGAAAAHPVAALGGATSVGGKLSVPITWSGASGPRRQWGTPSRSAASARHRRRPASRGISSVACRCPVPVPAGMGSPVPSTASGPPSWPDRLSRDRFSASRSRAGPAAHPSEPSRAPPGGAAPHLVWPLSAAGFLPRARVFVSARSPGKGPRGRGAERVADGRTRMFPQVVTVPARRDRCRPDSAAAPEHRFPKCRRWDGGRIAERRCSGEST